MSPRSSLIQIHLTTVEPRNSVLQNSGKTRISEQFSNDPAITEEFCVTKLSAFAGFYCIWNCQKPKFAEKKIYNFAILE